MSSSTPTRPAPATRIWLSRWASAPAWPATASRSATATEWVALLADAQRRGRLDDELGRLQRFPLLIVDEIGYIPFDPQAANLMFMLVARRYERASLIVTSNKPFSAWGEIFGDDSRRRRDDRPTRPPRRDPRPQRRQLPPQRPRPRPPTRRRTRDDCDPALGTRSASAIAHAPLRLAYMKREPLSNGGALAGRKLAAGRPRPISALAVRRRR